MSKEKEIQIKPMSRREERELALRGIFQIDFHEEPADRDISLKNFFEQAGQGDREDEVAGRSKGYAEEIVETVKAHQEAIDGLIAEHLKQDWSMDRLPHVEKAIMRMTVAELLFLKIPKEIAINEAVELVKQYGEEGSRVFVNGILNRIAVDNAALLSEA